MSDAPSRSDDDLYKAVAFWLADRDIHEQLDHADTKPSDEDLANREALEDDRVDYYLHEFQQHGFNRVVIDTNRRVLCEEEPIE